MDYLRKSLTNRVPSILPHMIMTYLAHGNESGYKITLTTVQALFPQLFPKERQNLLYKVPFEKMARHG